MRTSKLYTAHLIENNSSKNLFVFLYSIHRLKKLLQREQVIQRVSLFTYVIELKIVAQLSINYPIPIAIQCKVVRIKFFTNYTCVKEHVFALPIVVAIAQFQFSIISPLMGMCRWMGSHFSTVAAPRKL